MSLNPSIFKSYDIRGIYPQDLDEEGIVSITRSIYSFFRNKIAKEKLNFVLGRDMRLSSPSLSEKAKETLVSLGAEVIDVGLVSTPTFYFAVFNGGYDCGIQISASHNPKEYNGVKIVMNSKKGLIKIGKTTGMADIKKGSFEGLEIEERGNGNIRNETGFVAKEVEKALEITGNPSLKEFKVVADPANAMGALYIEELFKKIPGNLIKMNFQLDGTFPAHQADPLQHETLKDLQRKVIEEKADLGLAPDGDGDRLFFIDERGEIVPPSVITSLVARELLKNNPGETILFDIRYILTPKKIVEENGGKYEITKVGHAFITEKLHETGGIFAGESSAHFFFRETGNGEAPLPVIITVLSVMTREGKKLSELAWELKRSEESGEINFKVENAKEIMDELKNKYSDGEFSDLDGISIDYPSWRFSVRTSNTEPLLRLNVESLTKEEMEEKRDEIVKLIQNLKK